MKKLPLGETEHRIMSWFGHAKQADTKILLKNLSQQAPIKNLCQTEA